MTETDVYIEVFVALPVPHTYTYKVPETLTKQISEGKRVLVPFGQRTITGYIRKECKNERNIDTKPVLDILDEVPLFPKSMIPLFEWISNYYLYPIGEVIKSALPGGINVNDYSTFDITPEGQCALLGKKITRLERTILSCFKNGPLPLKIISREIKRNVPYSSIYSLKKKKLIVQEKKLKMGETRIKTEKYILAVNHHLLLDNLTLKKSQLVSTVRNEKEISLSELKKLHPSASNHLKKLEKDKYISVIDKQVYRDPFGNSILKDTPPILTDEQEHAVNTVVNALGKSFTSFLLFGVTGSGKTEVYMKICTKTLSMGYTALVLVPEIALISQTERRFRARFGEKIAVLHSGLSAGERYDQWLRILNKETPIVIGARSAIFAPLENLGVIIVDEEHDSSYKQDTSLRYNARDLAIVRAKQESGIALIGSATPSIQSYYNVIVKKFELLTLKNRINKKPLPEIQVVDLRKYRDNRGKDRFITPPLFKSIKETLSKKEQVLLFLNRRGFANFPVCATCGETLKCKYCDISLTLHKKINAFKCHFCGFSIASVSSCNICGSSNIKNIGLGTERVEEAIKALFPDASTKRMDQDTTKRKGSLLKILKDLKEKKTDILIGTQMIAKGHDFPGITLVGIICADLSLNFPDFRASERTFQLLAQVAGRAGRGEIKGRVIMQTYAPEHFSIVAAQHQDFIQFYNQEITFRKGLLYPPYTRIIQLKISGKDIGKTKQYALEIGNFFHDLKTTEKEICNPIQIMGPIESAIYKMANRYRWQILLKSAHIKDLHHFTKKFLTSKLYKKSTHNIKVVIDVDPYFMM